MDQKPTKPTARNAAVKISRKAARDRGARDFETYLTERLPTILEQILGEVVQLRGELEEMNRGPGTPK